MAKKKIESHKDFSVFDTFSNSFEVFKENFFSISLVSVLFAILAFFPDVNFSDKVPFTSEFLYFVLSVFIYGPLYSGFIYLHLKFFRERKVVYGNLLQAFQKNYFEVIIGNIIMAVMIIVGLIFIIIPGIYLMLRLSLVNFLILDKNLTATQAIKRSFELTKGHSFKIFGFYILSFFIIMIGSLFFVIGFFPALSFVITSYANLYESLLKNKN